ncbi:MAG: lytic murein transglycosylase [Deltaproteobacteria bacterium]|nr:lytic murein transglycosylase [Deltaproteobacteria bacterium]
MATRLNAAVSRTVPQTLRKDPARIVFSCIFAVIFLLLLLGTVRSAAADWRPLVERLAADGFNRSAMETLFARPEVRFEPDAMAEKIKALVRSQSSGPDSPAERMKNAVRRDYLNRWTIDRARSYTVDNLAVLEQIHALYGVPKEIVVSILLIETNLGRNTGNRCVFNRLASMALSADLETVRPHLDPKTIAGENERFARRRCREKGDWAYDEIKALLRLADRDGVDPLGIRGSIYGAIGLCQFMPSNVSIYGVDADGDGRIDLFTMADALHSIANYLRGHGWRPEMDRNGQHRVIFDYNNSTVYANTVLAVAERLKDRSRTRP